MPSPTSVTTGSLTDSARSDRIRAQAVAGLFYPKDAEQLRKTVQTYLREAPEISLAPKALIVPHAGYMYSGAIAATAYKSLAAIKNKISRVVLLGPSHRVPFVGVASSQANSFSTPLGLVECDREFIAKIEQLGLVKPLDIAHADEHSLEVHLPFLQESLPHFRLVPLVVGEIKKEAMEKVIASVWNDSQTLLVVSTDLSHYLNYEEARFVDRKTSAQIENLDASLNGEQACGCMPLNGLLAYCKHRGLSITNVDLRNSGDTSGNKSRVVGYGAYVVH